jgi:hypothetical protein
MDESADPVSMPDPIGIRIHSSRHLDVSIERCALVE